MGEKMTATQAQSFDRKSLPHELILADAAESRGCACQAYVDWFTYRRWQAQGMQVQRGEHGVKLTTYIPVKKVNTKTGEEKITGTRPKGYTVFCRHQVQPK